MLVLSFLRFERMLTPVLVQIGFWLATIGSVVAGLFSVAHALLRRPSELERMMGTSGSAAEFFGGLLLIVFGPLVARLVAESVIVLFKIHQELVELRSQAGRI